MSQCQPEHPSVPAIMVGTCSAANGRLSFEHVQASRLAQAIIPDKPHLFIIDTVTHDHVVDEALKDTQNVTLQVQGIVKRVAEKVSESLHFLISIVSIRQGKQSVRQNDVLIFLPFAAVAAVLAIQTKYGPEHHESWVFRVGLTWLRLAFVLPVRFGLFDCQGGWDRWCSLMNTIPLAYVLAMTYVFWKSAELNHIVRLVLSSELLGQASHLTIMSHCIVRAAS